jgi:phage host-nuclease inhibitor protein Gam
MTVASHNAGNGEEQYKELVDLLALFSAASTQIAELQARADKALLATVDHERPEFALLTSTVEEAEKNIRKLASQHPEWADGRTIKTPYGQVQFRRSSKLVAASPEASIELIRVKLKDRDPREFIRTVEELDLEALAGLEDALLAKVGIRRETVDSITIKPAKVDLGKIAGKKQEKT